MNRGSFLKMLGGGVVGSALVPTILRASDEVKEIKNPSYAIDINAISQFTIGGKKISPSEVLGLWRETGILIYNSHLGSPPIVFNGEIEVIDYNNKW